MIITGKISRIRKVIEGAKKSGKAVGLVPTMGALHQGHLSLVRAARRECGFVAVSIFVNPAQFGPREDFKKYPRNFKKDRGRLKKEKTDLIFYPAAKMMYPEDFSSYLNECALSRILCGRFRPGHFRGVCTIVAKLFNIVEPDLVYFGQKDYQQAQVIKRMARDLNFPLKVRVLPIIREQDGLALSSRNAYLNPGQRKKAALLFKSLNLAKGLIKGGERDSGKIIKRMKSFLTPLRPAQVDYIEIVDVDTFKPVKRVKGRILIALAVHVGRARLIDNIIVHA